IDEFSYVLQIASQVSVSLEVLEILNKQNAIKQELELNLAKMVENNKVLDIMSHSDPLTGIANRRGFLDTVNGILTDERNYGRKAIAVYADMDNLKIVNDEFGHDEGDFSLKTIAKALSESFRQSDVVARMGGDEFAAFAIVSNDNFADELKQRIHSILAKMNENDKPYYVNMSIGTHEFVIDENTNLDHVLNAADTNLYKEKKNKKKVVYKNLQ
ncbi:MAG: GGDEF domain-containing protein, partial [Lachnospiraceae bacterium]|nr:GGDEF domain-containing protein [Lachnospiraceae bacterium]